MTQQTTTHNGRICQYKHHEHTGEPVPDCSRCGEQMYCGPFYHRCKNCSPFWFAKCRKCTAVRLYCCC